MAEEKIRQSKINHNTNELCIDIKQHQRAYEQNKAKNKHFWKRACGSMTNWEKHESVYYSKPIVDLSRKYAHWLNIEWKSVNVYNFSHYTIMSKSPYNLIPIIIPLTNGAFGYLYNDNGIFVHRLPHYSPDRRRQLIFKPLHTVYTTAIRNWGGHCFPIYYAGKKGVSFSSDNRIPSVEKMLLDTRNLCYLWPKLEISLQRIKEDIHSKYLCNVNGLNIFNGYPFDAFLIKGAQFTYVHNQRIIIITGGVFRDSLIKNAFIFDLDKQQFVQKKIELLCLHHAALLTPCNRYILIIGGLVPRSGRRILEQSICLEPRVGVQLINITTEPWSLQKTINLSIPFRKGKENVFLTGSSRLLWDKAVGGFIIRMKKRETVPMDIVKLIAKYLYNDCLHYVKNKKHISISLQLLF